MFAFTISLSKIPLQIMKSFVFKLNDFSELHEKINLYGCIELNLIGLKPISCNAKLPNDNCNQFDSRPKVSLV
jgi:hypothetical protein